MVSLEEDGVVGVPSEGAVLAGVRAVVDVVGAGGGGVERGAGLELVVGVGDAGALEGLDERVRPAGKERISKKENEIMIALGFRIS